MSLSRDQCDGRMSTTLDNKYPHEKEEGLDMSIGVLRSLGYPFSFFLLTRGLSNPFSFSLGSRYAL